MFETILNNPGLQHLAENIFFNLDVEHLQICGLLNKSSKQIFESPMFQNPMFWLRKFQQFSIDNQNGWANGTQSLNNYKRKYAIISYLRWNLKKGDMMDLRCYDSPDVQNYFRKFIRRICGCPLPRDLKQLIAVLRNPNSSQQEKDEVMSILNSNPSLMAAFIRQQAMMQQQQHGGQGGPQPLAAGGGHGQQQPGMPGQGQPGQGQPQGQSQVMTSSAQQPPMQMGQPQMGGNMPPQQQPPQQQQQMMQQQRYRNIQLQQQQQQQQQQQTQNFGNFQQPAPPYPGAMRPGNAQGPGQYGGPNMMQNAMGGHGPQTSVSMAAQQMLAQVRSPNAPNVRSPGPRVPMHGMPGMSPRMQQSPRHPNQPLLPDDGLMLSQQGGPQPPNQGGGPGGPGGPGDQDNGMTPQDQLSKFVDTL